MTSERQQAIMDFMRQDPFAAAGKSRGQVAVAQDMLVCFMKATGAGDELVAEAEEIQLNGPLAFTRLR